MQSKQQSIGIGKSSDKPAGSKIMSSSSSECAIKVRKPYTISKQRERWTDEEHDKFLEALRLYGRSWCKLEEHIGTKTAVQIRSHAQKFFAKVARESRGDVPDGRQDKIKAIEIPPPRPKKKPARPYPRKLENTLIMQVNKQELLATPNAKVIAQEDMSPTSVVCTDASNSLSSPISCANQSCQSGTTSVEYESKSNSNNKSDMDTDLVSDDTAEGKGPSSVEGSTASVKLFGKTLVVPEPVPEPCKAQCPTEENNHQFHLWTNGTGPMFYLLPVWGFYGGSELHVPQAQMIMSPEEGESAFCAENFDSSASSAELGVDSKKMENGAGFKACKLKQSETSAFRSVKACPNKAGSRGFMPYKSCVIAEREVTQNSHVGGEDEVQLCL